MKKILFSLIAFIGLCCSFSSAGSVTYTGSYNIVHQTANFYSSNYLFAIKLPPLDYSYSDNSIINVNCQLSNFSGLVSLFGSDGFNFNRYGYVIGSTISSVTIQLLNSYSSFDFDFTLDNFKSQLTFQGQSLQPLFIGFANKNNITGLSCSSSSKCYLSYDYSCTFSGDSILSVGGSSSCDYSDYVLESDITQSYCTNKFSNLIPESDITQSYCEVEFGLIDPENCPSSGGTGDILWSSFWVNDRQIEGASNIYLYMPDFLSWDYTYLNSGSTLQIDVENEGDEDYINDLLTIETYHPSSDEFAVSFVGYLTLLMPYIVITLFIAFIWRLIKRIFK